MKTKELWHRELIEIIIQAQLDPSDLEVVTPFFDEEKSNYFQLLAACFTVLPNKGNKRFIDILKDKTKVPIDYEYLGFMLHTIGKRDYEGIPGEFDDTSLMPVAAFLLPNFVHNTDNYLYLIQCLQNDPKLKKYAEWLNSCKDKSSSSIPYKEFFSLVFIEEERNYIDSLLSLTANNTDNQSFFDYAKIVLQSYSFGDDELSNVVMGFIKALTAVIKNDCSEAALVEYNKAAELLHNKLQEPKYAKRLSEEQNKAIGAVGCYALSALFFAGAILASLTVPALLIPGVGIAAALAICAIVIPAVMALTVIAEKVFCAKTDAPVLAKETLTKGEEYFQFFKEKNEKTAQNDNAELQDNPVLDFSRAGI
jgi:hypothetical protein